MDKKIVITGATSGIGYSIYKALQNSDDFKNSKIAVISRHSSQKMSLFNHDTLLLNADISQKGEVESAADKAINHLGGIDILINNAGMTIPSYFADKSKEEIESTIAVNLLGPMYITHSFLPYLYKGNNSIIVNISSAAGETGIPGLAAYSAAKFGLKGFTEAIRKELADRNIRIIDISPGGVATPIHNTLIARKGKDSVNMKYALEPDVVANAVIYAIIQPANTSIHEIKISHSSLKMIGTYI